MIPLAVEDALHEQAPQEPDVEAVFESYETEPDFESDVGLNSESLNIDFQMLSINDPVDIVVNNVESVNHSVVRLSEWQEILSRFSSDILIREQKVASKEKTLSLYESRSKLLECIICMDDICSIIIFPCKHLIMCKPCFDSHTENSDVLHSCPVCRTIIQSNSHVYLA